MNIDDKANEIVQKIVAQITEQVQKDEKLAITQKITETIASVDITAIITGKINEIINSQLAQLSINASSIATVLSNRVNSMADGIGVNIQAQSMLAASESINAQVSRIDFPQLCQATLLSAIKSQEFVFNEDSIPPNALQRAGLILSGDNIIGGMIHGFSSTGIDDKATACQLSIFDDVTVIENNLVTRDLTVKGTTTIEGDLNVTGTLPQSSALYQDIVSSVSSAVRGQMDQTVFQGYADSVFQLIREKGLDLTQIRLNGQDVVNGGHLSGSITYSNLQHVGVVVDLQTTGENLLSQTLYVSNKRVGINTIEPSQVLSVWDQEIEIGFGKQSSNTGIIGVPRNQTLIISSNGKNNLVLNPDGSTDANQINLNGVVLTAADSPPTDNRRKGTIVFNSNPNLGGPLGWISLGEARWANFGFID